MVSREADLDRSFGNLGKAQQPVSKPGKAPSIHLMPFCTAADSGNLGAKRADQRLTQTAKIGSLFRAPLPACVSSGSLASFCAPRQAGFYRKPSAGSREPCTSSTTPSQTLGFPIFRCTLQLDKTDILCMHMYPVVLIMA